MLLLFIRNLWDDSYSYTSVPHADAPPVKESTGDKIPEDAAVERPKPAPAVPDLNPEPAPVPNIPALAGDKMDEHVAQNEEEGEGLGVNAPAVEVSTGNKGTTSPTENTHGEVRPDDEIGNANNEGGESEISPAIEEAVDIHSQNPPNDGTSVVIEDQPDVHWKPVPEHYPIPEDEITPLPTGAPKPIPKIQYEFGPESEDARRTRQQRLKRVKDEIERAWGGYKKFAWMHDELSPVSAKYRDPFCGWAATLVDALDTLWIAGLEDEFDEAAKAVKEIDFTITERNEIPVFETTIRYLGGLLAAFDVSGGKQGKYSILLEKAVELATILMGMFDTPNRMPVLYYDWKPDYASQPKVAGTVGLAELATLSMEFTRLAQLTGEDKYYDAINRITDGLIELQEAGRSQIPGLFPENLDASGCNKTATTLRGALSRAAQKQMESADVQDEPLGYVPGSSASLGTETSETKDSDSGEEDNDLHIVQHQRRDTSELAEELSMAERDPELNAEALSGDSSPLPPSNDHSVIETIPDPDEDDEPGVAQMPPFAADGSHTEWECVHQGLVPSGYGSSSFHMGGGQDSAYEYFPKEWLLLGGQEPKYQKLYEDSVKAINEWLLYRPMVEGEWDALFTAKVSVTAPLKEDYDPKYEVTHLTCFIGGMYGLGGKIFGREQDIEIAKRLTDGCVWAYESMPSGLMPEHAYVAPCPTLEKCEFNETLWREKLDPGRDWREREIIRWDAMEKEEQEYLEQKKADDLVSHENMEPGSIAGDAHVAEDLDKHSTTVDEMEGKEAENPAIADPHAEDGTVTPPVSSLRKRAAIPVDEKVTSPDVDENAGSELPDSLKKKLGLDVEEEPKAADLPITVDESLSSASDPDSFDQWLEAENNPVQDEDKPDIPVGIGSGGFFTKMERPLDHEAFVNKMVTEFGLKPGFMEITSRSYILRYVTPRFTASITALFPLSHSKE